MFKMTPWVCFRSNKVSLIKLQCLKPKSGEVVIKMKIPNGKLIIFIVVID